MSELNAVQEAALKRLNHCYVKVLCDSIHNGNRLTTIEYRAPRCILAEINTHRVFSRNARSSRAVPTATIMKELKARPYIPVWVRNQPGMVGTELYPEEHSEYLDQNWLNVMYAACYSLEAFRHLDPHKQAMNRLLEPWMWVYGVISSTTWDNFLELRDHPDADPALFVLAYRIKEALRNSKPTVIGFGVSPSDEGGNWHLPYVTEDDIRSAPTPVDFRFVSAARCARVSWAPFHSSDERHLIETDEAKGRKLYAHRPPHASPFEHVATPLDGRASHAGLTGNFTGWNQFRKILEKGLE